MVTVTGYKTKQAKDGSTFILLELQGSLEMVQSQETGKFYATIRSCTVSTTFDEITAKALVGTQMPGRVARVECTPYVYTNEQTGEVFTLAHRWSFLPEGTAAAPLEPVLD